MKCYTTNNEPEELELTQIRERLVKMIEQVGGEQSAKEFRYFEILVCSRACVVGYEGAMSETLPFVSARRLVELIKRSVITEDEALAAIDEKQTRRRKPREAEALAA